MSEKVTGKNTSALAYFGALLGFFAVLALVLFAVQVAAADGNIIARLFGREMIYLQALLIGLLAPSLAICSYLALGLKLTSRFFKQVLLYAAAAMLIIFPIVSPLGVYTLWLHRRSVKGGASPASQ